MMSDMLPTDKELEDFLDIEYPCNGGQAYEQESPMAGEQGQSSGNASTSTDAYWNNWVYEAIAGETRVYPMNYPDFG